MIEVKVFQTDMHHLMAVNKELGLRLLVAPKKEDVGAALALGTYAHIASLQIEAETPEVALEQAFAKTQNFDGNWCQGPGVQAKVSEARSTMVGDLFEIDGHRHVVVMVGFASLDD